MKKSAKASKDLLKGYMIALHEILEVWRSCFSVMLASLAR